MTLKHLVICAALAFSSSLAQSDELKPYRLVYTAKYSFIMPFKGTATRELKQLDSGEWRLSHKVKSAMIKVQESSRFLWDDNVARPQEYKYYQSALTKKRKENLVFDWGALKVTNRSPKEPLVFDITEGTQDKMTLHTQIRQSFLAAKPLEKAAVADKKRLKKYLFEHLGEEQIDTPVGPLNTVKIRRVHKPGSSRDTEIWLAKDWGYVIAKIKHTEKGKSYEIRLQEGEYDNLPVAGVRPLVE